MIFTPPLVAGLASVVPSLLAGLWKVTSPSYHCNLRNPQPVWDSPCFAVAFLVACALGWRALV